MHFSILSAKSNFFEVGQAHFSRMRSKGSRFTLGVWGLRVCSLGVAFTAATVRNRPCEDRMAVPMVSSAEVVIFGYFWRFPTFRCFVSRGRRGTS